MNTQRFVFILQRFVFLLQRPNLKLKPPVSNLPRSVPILEAPRIRLGAPSPKTAPFVSITDASKTIFQASR